MSMMKRVTLTINKNNAGVKLSSPLKFYKNDSILLQFEIEKWNFEKKQDELVKPMYAVAFVETPNGTDMIECTILDGQTVQFQLLSRHTSIIGQGRMQIIVRDGHEDGDESCQSATPPFIYEVEDLINDAQILTNEYGEVITSNAMPIMSANGFTTIDSLEEIDMLGEDAYILITENGRSYKMRASLLNSGVSNEQYNELLDKYEELANRLAILEGQEV